MIYLKEIQIRFYYFLLASITTIVLLYWLKEKFLFILILTTIFSDTFIDYFIFTNPSEIFFFYFSIGIFFFFIFLFPYCLWAFLDYLKPSFFSCEWKQIYQVITKIYLILLFLNLINFFVFFPFFWNFFTSFDLNSQVSYVSTPFFLELSALNYLSFFFNNFLLSNMLFIFFFLFVYFILFFGLINEQIIYAKNYCILFALFFSTLLTPPQLELQIFLFGSLYICIEIFFLFYFVREMYENYNGSQLKVNNTENINIR